MIRQHKSTTRKASSNIGCIVSLDPLDDLNIDELAEFLKWQREVSGETAEQFYAHPREHRLALFLIWCARLALNGYYIGVRILAKPMKATAT